MHVPSIAVAPNGRLLASNTPYRRWCPSDSVGGSIRLWSLHSNTPALTLAGHLERNFNGHGSTGTGVLSRRQPAVLRVGRREGVWMVYDNGTTSVEELGCYCAGDRILVATGEGPPCIVARVIQFIRHPLPPLCFFDVLDAKECSRVALIDLPVDVKKIAVSSSGKLLAAVTAEGIKVL